MKEFFVHIYRILSKRKIIPITLFVALLALFTLLAIQIRFVSDMTAMMPFDEKSKNSQKLLLQSKAMDKIIVSVSGKNLDPEILTSYIDEFERTLKNIDTTQLIAKVETRQDDEKLPGLLDALIDNLPFLLTEKDYPELDSLITKEQIETKLRENLATLSNANGMVMKQLLLKDPLGISLPAIKKLNHLKLDENIQLFDGYLSNKENDAFTFFIYTTAPATDTKANEGLETLLEQTKNILKQDSAFQNVSCHAFGAQMVAAGNATQMRSDTYLTLSLTLTLLLILFIYFFKSPLAPIQIIIPVIFGGLFGLAMMYLIRGQVSLIALGASSVILGIAVNYSLHFMSHWRHANSKEDSIRELTLPMTIGSFTTIAAFLGLTLVHTPVLQELGLFTAFNLMGSSICTLVFLPHFIGNKKADKKGTQNLIEKLSHYQPNKNKWLVAIIVLVTIFLGYFMNGVQFNEDMMKMNYMSKELREAQKIVNERNSESLNSMFYVNEGKTFEEVLRLNEISTEQLLKAKNSGLVKKVNSISQFIHSDSLQQEKIRQWNQFWTNEKKQQCLETLISTGKQLGYQTLAFEGMSNMLNKKYEREDSGYTLLFKDLLKDLIIEEKGSVKLLTLIKITQDKRNDLYQKFEKTQSGFLTDRQALTAQFVQFIKADFYQILLWTSFIVFFTILISYGRIEIALISFIPMVVTWVCILGLMSILGIEFNIINIIISTLIFGLGDDYSIFITDGLIEKYKYGKLKINSTKTSILLSAITTIIGLGILIFAKHPALQSIAMVSVIGILSILLVSQTLQPLLFNFFIQNRTHRKFHPFTLWSFAKTLFAFFYYVSGCILVTLVGFILTRCIPVAKDKMKYAYHVVVSKMMWSLLYIMANVRKKIEGAHHADFSKPSVIIANHASFLDLLRIISLHPKILLMTNKWVWRSPVFGALVRMADYYPVEEGAEFSVDKLQYWVNRGYSIAVFPEGTRSYDDRIKRFHKGAFYIAEKLQLDIQPVLFHGIGYSMSKGDFLLKNGEVNARYLPRIPINDISYGTHYAERAKKIGKYFRAEFEKYKKERENTFYFKEQLIKNYIYKGPVLEWYCRIKTKLENYYAPIEKWVPAKGQILNIGCGYGFLDYMMAWTSAERNITAIDYDEEKIAVANHNFSKTDQLQFLCADALDFPAQNLYHCILILDVLHYLTPEKQEHLLQKCYHSLHTGGILIVRDGLKDMSKKHKGTELTELFSTRLFNFNKTENELHFISRLFLEKFAYRNQLKLEILDQTRFTSNIIALFTK